MIKNILTTVLIISGLATGVMADQGRAGFVNVNFTGETDPFSGMDLSRSFRAGDFSPDFPHERAGFAKADAFSAKKKQHDAFYGTTEPQSEVQVSWFSLGYFPKMLQASLLGTFGSLMQRMVPIGVLKRFAR